MRSPSRAGAAQQLGDHAVGERLLAGVRPRPQHPGAARRDRLERLLREARLADARLALDQHERRALVVRVEQPPELARAPDERELDDPPGTGALATGAARAAAADRVVELGRLAQRRDPQLGVEHAHAAPVLLERVAAATGARRRGRSAGGGWARAAGRARAARRRRRSPRRSGPSSASASARRSSSAARSRRVSSCASRCQSSNSTLSRSANPASRSPRCSAAAAVSSSTPASGSAARRTRLGEVEEGAVQIQPDVEPVAAQAALAERAAQRRERPPQRRARALGVGVGPQQFGDERPRVRVAGDREVGEHRRRLARVDGQRLAVHLDDGSPQQRDAQRPHAASMPRARNGLGRSLVTVTARRWRAP